jgi:hypothetical protein
MAEQERKDIQTRFKKGQSGNPRGRPRGRKNNAGPLSDAFFTSVRKDAAGIRSVPKIVAAEEVCLNNALKGDLRSFAKAMEIAEKFGVLEPARIHSTQVFLKAFFSQEWSSIQLERPKLPLEIRNRVAVDEGHAGFPREKRHHARGLFEEHRNAGYRHSGQLRSGRPQALAARNWRSSRSPYSNSRGTGRP